MSSGFIKEKEKLLFTIGAAMLVAVFLAIAIMMMNIGIIYPITIDAHFLFEKK